MDSRCNADTDLAYGDIPVLEHSNTSLNGRSSGAVDSVGLPFLLGR